MVDSRSNPALGEGTNRLIEGGGDGGGGGTIIGEDEKRGSVIGGERGVESRV